MDKKTSQYLLWPPFFSCSMTSPSYRVNQAVDCGQWNVPLLFNYCEVAGYWNTLSYLSIQSIPNMLNGWHVWWLCRQLKNWDIFSFQELCTDPCDMTWGCAFLCIHDYWFQLHFQPTYKQVLWMYCYKSTSKVCHDFRRSWFLSLFGQRLASPVF